MGLFHQFLSPQLKPIDAGMVILGHAMPVLEADYFQQSGPGNSALSEKPFGLMFHALDDLQTNEVYICVGGSLRYAQWGEINVHTHQTMRCGRGGGPRLSSGQK